MLLDSLALREETAGLARFLFEDFAHYFKSRKPRDQYALLIVDEFSGLAAGSGMAARIEQARGFNTGLVLAPQVVAGMGEPEQAARILGSVETVICHRVNTPEQIIASPGRAGRWSTPPTTPRTASPARAPPASSTSTRSTPTRSAPSQPGTAYVISRGKAMRIAVLRAPQITSPLPAAGRIGGG